MAIRVQNTEGVYETLDAGFYGTDSETYYVTPSGRIWIVASEDDLGTSDPVERLAVDLDGLDLKPVGDLLTPDEAIEHCRRVESASGESLIVEA